MSRPPVFTWNEDLHFGPPSEPVSIQKFLDEAEKLTLSGIFPWLDGATQGTSKDDVYNSITGWEDWKGVSDETRASVEMDCKCVCIAPSDPLKLTWAQRLEDIKSPITATLKSQKHGSYLQKMHAAALGELTTPRTRKRSETNNLDDGDLEPLKQAIEQTPLKMWRSMSHCFLTLRRLQAALVL